MCVVCIVCVVMCILCFVSREADAGRAARAIARALAPGYHEGRVCVWRSQRHRTGRNCNVHIFGLFGDG